MELVDAVAHLESFKGLDLTLTLSQIESSLQQEENDKISKLLADYHVHSETLAAAGLIKNLAGQINVMIHALGILLCLSSILEPDEVVESVSLGAGNTGKKFDLETNRRIAEFKFINWQGGPEAIRQNSLFKDFYGLVEYQTIKKKYLYVLGTTIPLRFFNGRRALDSVLSKNVTLHNEFRNKYPEYKVVSDYYLPRQKLVTIQDASPWLIGLTESVGR